ncbi:MAG: flagellar hook protein FlgE [Pseudomonadota bacterium]
MGFQSGLSGLNSAAKNLDVIGNNVANSSVVGFKSSAAQFSDVFANSLSGAGTNAIGIGSKIQNVSQEFSQGNISVTNNPLDVAINGRGFFRMSDNGALTYSRNGQFHFDSSGYIVNSNNIRLTGYTVDALGNIVPTSPVELQISNADIAPQVTSQFQVGANFDARSAYPSGFTAGSAVGSALAGLTINAGNDELTVTVDGITTGTITIPSATYASASALATQLQSLINSDANLVAASKSVTVSQNAGVLTIQSNSGGATSSIAVANVGADTTVANLFGVPTITAGTGAFSTLDPTTFNSSTSGTVYDSLGNSHVFTMYFVKQSSVASNWDVYATVDGTSLSNVNLGAGAGLPQQLNFTTSGQLTTPMPLNASLTLTNGAATPLNFTLDFRGSTQFGSNFGVNTLTQDGYTSGRLSGFSIGSDGTIQGRYSNGRSKNLGQIVLVNFINPQGLKPLGNNLWGETSNSGLPILGSPGSGSLGALQAAAVEDSNVDLTAELVNMITAQRVYQANAQSIKTQDQVLQTLVNLR